MAQTNNKISMLHNVTSGECLKRRKRFFLPSDRLQALEQITQGLPQVLLIWVLMGTYTEAEIQFSLDLYCIFSPFWTCILESATV